MRGEIPGSQGNFFQRIDIVVRLQRQLDERDLHSHSLGESELLVKPLEDPRIDDPFMEEGPGR
jgi:hypothetical protein